ncbi:expressed unknown protein [Seminavis robusta]|uniref:Uncharacterized protein n=1 Tax=Seminavis robusta TaxID=568900 RepID=A0A9N8DQJ1_9STRA|nr:expressed unknown protein [Seminavis robusta]|eukprot:Sro268_g103670.1 n/a (118) ;mRNA; f:34015-34453
MQIATPDNDSCAKNTTPPRFFWKHIMPRKTKERPARRKIVALPVGSTSSSPTCQKSLPIVLFTPNIDALEESDRRESNTMRQVPQLEQQEESEGEEEEDRSSLWNDMEIFLATLPVW